MIKIKGFQVKAARALLGWSQTDLADVSHLSQSLIARMESGSERVKESTLMLLTINLQQAGIRFINEDDGTVGVVLMPKEGREAQGGEKTGGEG